MTFRIGVVGIGKVALKNYLPHLTSRGDVQLAFLSRSPQAVQQAIDDFGGVGMADAYALAQWNPDAVLVLTADHAHHAAVRDLIAAGVRRIFVEKPLVADNGQAAVSEEDFFSATELVRAASASGIVVAMNFNYRSFESVQIAKKIAVERAFGRVISASAMSHFACWSHVIDLVGQLVGTVSHVTALRSAHAREGAGLVAPDLAVAFRTADDATGTLVGTAGLAWQHSLVDVTVVYERGRIHLSDLDGNLVIHDSRSQRSETIAPSRDSSRWDAYARSFQAAIDAYLDSILEGNSPPVPVLDGLQELRIEAAVQRSITVGRTVSLETDFPMP